MPRPIKCRKIEKLPECSYFKPMGVPLYELEEVTLKIEEFEAIRLKDSVGLDQSSCSEKMAVSRQTFQRIYYSAKEKIADALVNGKAIKIQGGNYSKSKCKMICKDCNSEVEIVFDSKEEIKCPNCESRLLVCKHEGQCQSRCNHGNHGRKEK